MQPSVRTIRDLGRLPDSEVDEATIKPWDDALTAIERPVTDAEAAALMNALPTREDDCYGLAWTLLHHAETAPGYGRELVEGAAPTGYWKDLLLARLRNAG